jgi:SAM-dependent methyltransferase
MQLEPGRCFLDSSVPEKLVRRARSWLDEVEGTFDVRACPRCGAWITSPRLRREDLHEVYPPGYHDRRLPEAVSHTRAPHSGRFLDLGCGVGNALAAARTEGWSCVGVEISEEAAAVARSRGFDVIVGDAEDVELGEDEFDLIRCAHTLEHLTDPGHVLAKLARAVKPDGEILVVVPNRSSLTSALFRRYWYHLDVPRHLFHYRPRDISALAAKSGLRIRSEHHSASPSGLLGSIDCVLAGLTGRAASRLRSRPVVRRLAQVATVPLALAHLADVVEYRLVRD